MSREKHIAVAGATGAVGLEILKCLEQRNFPVGELTLLASARSAGKKLAFRGSDVTVRELRSDSFAGVDIALFSAGSAQSNTFAAAAAAAGATVVDNSSAFRMDPDIPLVVPEINPDDVRHAKKGIIANPNCTTIVTLMGLHPLHREFGVVSVVASSYQAVSGSGAQGIAELKAQVAAVVENRPVVKNVYPHQIAFNVIPMVESIGENGYTKEEMKMQNEGRKILHHDTLKASVTCVRVPVYRSHSIAVTASFERPVDLERARASIEAAPGVKLVDDREAGLFPTPLDSSDGDDCLVGRLRHDLVFENGLSFWVVGDQVRKGAALNAVQIAELI